MDESVQTSPLASSEKLDAVGLAEGDEQKVTNQQTTCDKEDNAPDASEQSAKKPARRRRLAHRRQYTKSRRLASSYLRSQFVRYDSNEADTFNIWKSSNQPASHEQMERELADKSDDQNDEHDSVAHVFGSCPTADQCPSMAVPVAMGGPSSRAPSESYDEWSADDALPIKQIINKQLERRHEQMVHRADTESVARASRTPEISIKPSHLLRATDGEPYGQLADCSSSSLDSGCSPIEPAARESWCDSLLPQRAGMARRTLKSTFNSTVAKSLMSLTSFAHSAGSSDNLASRLLHSNNNADDGAKFKMLVQRGHPIPRRSFAAFHEPTGGSSSSQLIHSPVALKVQESESRMQQQATSHEQQLDCNQVKHRSMESSQQALPMSRFFPTDLATGSSGQSSNASLYLDSKRYQFLSRPYDSSDSKGIVPSRQSAEGRFTAQFYSVDQIRTLKYQKENIDCIDNVHFNDLFHGTVNDSSTSVTVNQSVRTDPRLHKDDVDIKFSRALNSCKLPQIRYASKERLFERLTDLRFLSIDFLNTFLLTYRVFTTAEEVLNALKSVHYNSERYCAVSASNASVSRANGTQSQRDSFSCYTNASMINSLCNSQTAIPSSQLEGQEDCGKLSGTSPNFSPRLDSAQEALSGKPSARQTVPPPLPTQHSRLKQSPYVPPRSPNHALNQANSSSQLEQSTNLLLAPEVQQMQKRRSTISALTPITGSTSSSLVNLTAKGSRDDESKEHPLRQCHEEGFIKGPESVTNELASPTCGGSFKRANLTTDSSLNIQAGDLRQRSSSVCIHPTGDRSRTSGNLTTAADASSAGFTKNYNLLVPSRQVRASSLTHITPAILEVGVAHQASNQHQQQQIQGNEHWRLSYKKSIGSGKSSGVQAAARASSANLLTPNFIPSGEPTVPPRRRSAADVDSIKLEVTLSDGPSPSGPESSAGPTTPSNNLQAQCPSVPPPTPTPLSHQVSPSPESAKHEASSSPGATANKSSLTQQRELRTKLYSMLSDEHRANKQQHHHHGDKPAEQEGISSANSLLSPTSSQFSSEDDNRHNRIRLDSGRSSSSSSNVDSSRRAEAAAKKQHVLRKLDSVSRSRQQSFILKEIDLTQSKMVDSDTSADESEARSTDSSNDSAGESRSKQVVEASEKSARLQNAHDKTAQQREVRASALSEVQKGMIREDTKEQSAELPVTVNSIPGLKADQARLDDQQNAQAAVPKSEKQAKTVQQEPCPKMISKPKQSSSSCMTTPRSSFQYTAVDSILNSKAGVVVTSRSPRVSSRRSSTASAASAFAAATAASSNPLLTQPPLPMRQQLNKSPMGDLLTGCSSTIDPAHCACQNLHRGSISSIQTQRRQMQHMFGATHHPSCIHSHNSMANIASDASSLCNSRASSRLSSCAGLEFSYHSQQQQQLGNGPMRQAAGSQTYQGGSRESCQSSAGSLGCGHFGSSRYASQANIHQLKRNSTVQQNNAAQQSNLRSMATLRVLSVLRHWVSKHSQDFVNDSKLASMTQEFLQDLIIDTSLLPAEHKAAIQLQQMIQKAAYSHQNQIDMDVLLAPPTKPSADSIETLSALEIAEGMTYLDHKIFLAIKSEEFLGQAWMKSDKAIKAPHILLITKRFNDVSRLVASEIIRVPELQRRVAVIEKWTNVAHICRVIHNFNGVLQICAAFTNSSVFRLKKTWDKISKTTKATIDQLQNLVSTDSRFRNMRDAINRCDPPSIPYVGMYLTDLSFIEEGTPNWSPDGLLNFSKMRMIAHVIREIQHLQNGVYKMDLNPRVANYLLDASRHLQDDEMYRCSLAIEPRSSGAKNNVPPANSTTAMSNTNLSPSQQNPSPAAGLRKG